MHQAKEGKVLGQEERSVNRDTRAPVVEPDQLEIHSKSITLHDPTGILKLLDPNVFQFTL